MKKINSKGGFTLVEIMIVVAIIALLAAIAIPNLLRARMSANDALAKATLRAESTAAESFGTANNGNYPTDMNSLTTATPPFLNKNYCEGISNAGYMFYCTTNGASMSTAGYTFVAVPVTPGSSGTTTETITTGGVLSP